MFEVYDYNYEVIGTDDDIYGAIGLAEAYNAKFILDTETNEVVWGSDEED